VNIHISCNRDKHLVTFNVIDSGIGITEQQLDNIFSAFSQEDASTSRKYGGTGLGLSLSKLLVEKLGGTIDVESTKGVGSNFSVSIPADTLVDSEMAHNANEIPEIVYENQSNDTNGEHTLLMGRVLLAEDNEDNQQLLTMHLEKMGATVKTVGNGNLAVDEALNNDYDLVYMDMQMPVMDGEQAVKLLRKRNYSGTIVALTANAMKKDQEKYLSAGCDDFVSKPVDRNHFYQVTARYLKHDNRQPPEQNPLYSTLLGEDESFGYLLSQFIEKLPNRRDTLFNAFNNGDITTCKKIAHDLKGLGGNYGFDELSELAAKLMFQLEGEDHQVVPDLLTEIDNVFQRIYLGARQLPHQQTATR
ncbi:MAG: response regulator, partial [Gammaproteobacteria bacterium]